MIEAEFDCPVAGKTVIISTSVRVVRAGFPPVTEFKGCSGIATCGVEQAHGHGATYNWMICPVYRNMSG